jgi:hypothetical protein
MMMMNIWPAVYMGDAHSELNDSALRVFCPLSVRGMQHPPLPCNCFSMHRPIQRTITCRGGKCCQAAAQRINNTKYQNNSPW